MPLRGKKSIGKQKYTLCRKGGRNLIKNDPMLHSIDPVAEDRDASVVAKEVLSLIHGEYQLTIADLCRIFCCERQWIEDFFVPNVRHIHVNHFFMNYIINQNTDDLTAEEKVHLIRGHYFFSRKDLARFWSEKASASIKCTFIDLSSYLASGSTIRVLSLEKIRYSSSPKTKEEKARHDLEMRKLLTQEGYLCYKQSRLVAKFLWQPVKLPDLPLQLGPGSLISTTLYKNRNGLTSNGVARKRLMENGAIQIKLGGKTLWIEGKEPDGVWPVPCGVLLQKYTELAD